MVTRKDLVASRIGEGYSSHTLLFFSLLLAMLFMYFYHRILGMYEICNGVGTMCTGEL